MGRLVYAGIGSLDGFIADANGEFDWSMPDEEVHAYLNERDRRVVAELYGRRLYEVMRVWETSGTDPDSPDVERDYGEIWRNGDKAVYSTSLESVDTGRTTPIRSSSGGGKHWLPHGLRLPLRLVSERRFTGGVVHLAYEITDRG